MLKKVYIFHVFWHDMCQYLMFRDKEFWTYVHSQIKMQGDVFAEKTLSTT